MDLRREASHLATPDLSFGIVDGSDPLTYSNNQVGSPKFVQSKFAFAAGLNQNQLNDDMDITEQLEDGKMVTKTKNAVGMTVLIKDNAQSAEQKLRKQVYEFSKNRKKAVRNSIANKGVSLNLSLV
jgi:hypothetical protein